MTPPPRQALTGTRYPTLPGFYFYYPYPTRQLFQNFRVQGSDYTGCFPPIPYSEIEFRPQTTFSTCHQKFAFRPVDGSASDLRVIKNCSHITSKSLRVIVDELAMFWQFIKNCSQTFGSGLRANFDELTWNCSQTFGSGTQKKYNNDDKKNYNTVLDALINILAVYRYATYCDFCSYGCCSLVWWC